MKVLWLLVAVLGLVYLAIWAGTRENPPPVAKPIIATDASSPLEILEGVANGDAITRVPSGAEIEVLSATPKVFTGDDLRAVSPSSAGAIPGYEIVLRASVKKKDISTLTYHAAPPNKIVFVEQQNL